jgi:hypothetical protein
MFLQGLFQNLVGILSSGIHTYKVKKTLQDIQ